MSTYDVVIPPRDDRHEMMREIARIVLDVSNGSVDHIEILGYDGQLQEYVDREATEQVLSNPGVRVKDHIFSESDIVGELPGTQENIEAVIALFSVQLPKSIFVDANGEEILNRTEYESMRIKLSDGEDKSFEDALDDGFWEYIERF